MLFDSDVNAEIQKQLAEDMKFSIAVNDDGNCVVNWDCSGESQRRVHSSLR